MASSRRRRFYATMTHKTDFDLPRVERVVKAYTARQAVDYYQNLYPNYAVKVSTTPHPPKGERNGWSMRPGARAEAKYLLGLEYPVLIRTHSRAGGTNGNYRFKVDAAGDPYHEIMVKSYLSPSQATETLWHELTHAQQAERVSKASWLDPLAAWGNHQTEQRKHPYKRRPMEVEARMQASKLAPTHVLAV